jgi:hypothetical protein
VSRMPSRTRRASKKSSRKGNSTRWSGQVTRTSNALDLDHGVFSQRSARSIALSLKRSAERSRRRKSAPFRSAMSMLNLYINRAGKNLSAERKRTLERAKMELRRVFDRDVGHRQDKSS